MKIYIGSDHSGVGLKEKIKGFLDDNDIDYEDYGSFSSKSKDDYPDYAKIVSRMVKRDKDSRGILICGSGTGMVISANRFRGIRASLIYDSYSAKMSRKDNDSNIACFRSRGANSEEQINLLNIWLKTEFSKEVRHKRRIKKLDEA